MKVEVKSCKLDEVKAELMIIGRFEGERSLTPSLRRIDRALKGMIKEGIESGEFKGKPNEVLLLHTMGLIPTRRLLLVGLGKKEKFSLDILRRAVATAAKRGRDINVGTISVNMGADVKDNHPVERLAGAAVEGAMLGLYRFREYRKDEKDSEGEVRSLQLIVEENKALGESRRGAREGRIIGESVCYVRDLNNRPANLATPDYLARQARSIARKYGLKYRVLNASDMERKKMGAILAVAGGSKRQPRLIVLQHRGGGPSGRNIVLVGKGVTFDSGGISIKPGTNMDKMKYDKSGAVVVMGVLSSVARLGIPINVIGIIPAVENLPGGSAYRPGDILKTYSGKTVEVINTDAEGRLILADALAYGLTFKPSAMIDIATLTGACVVALGNLVAGLMGNDDQLLEEIVESGERTGERVWRFPLWDEYRDLIKSDFADLKNSGGREASVITAGMFLKDFIGEVPWAHIDIAGTAWTKEGGPYVPRGPSGMGVRLLVDFLERKATAGRKSTRREKKS